MKTTDVVAALIRDGERFLICQRGAQKSRALLWEFVGGKVESGETPQQALARECREELNIELEAGEIFMEALHEYPDISIRLMLLEARIVSGVPKLIEHNDLRWITPQEIDEYEFCPADTVFLPKLKAQKGAAHE